jgi:hypothetical protein
MARQLFHPDINGRKESYPLKYHGKKTEFPVGLAIIRRFKLPKDLL